jgi:hypothetical protein
VYRAVETRIATELGSDAGVAAFLLQAPDAPVE